jgi:hypothetical protein
LSLPRFNSIFRQLNLPLGFRINLLLSPVLRLPHPNKLCSNSPSLTFSKPKFRFRSLHKLRLTLLYPLIARTSLLMMLPMSNYPLTYQLPLGLCLCIFNSQCLICPQCLGLQLLHLRNVSAVYLSTRRGKTGTQLLTRAKRSLHMFLHLLLLPPKTLVTGINQQLPMGAAMNLTLSPQQLQAYETLLALGILDGSSPPDPVILDHLMECLDLQTPLQFPEPSPVNAPVNPTSTPYIFLPPLCLSLNPILQLDLRHLLPPPLRQPSLRHHRTRVPPCIPTLLLLFLCFHLICAMAESPP